MQNKREIERLYFYGHFNNPAHKTGVKKEDLSKLKVEDGVVKTALQSYQEFMAPDFDRLALHHHNRIGIADGEIGPATRDLLNIQRCGCPDYKDNVEMATGHGSWDAGCHPDYPDIHTFTVSVDKSNMPSFLGKKNDPNSLFEQAWELQKRAYANIGILFLRADGSNKANTQVTFTRGRGWIGLAIVPNNPGCGDRIWAKFDNRYSPSDMLNQWARLLCHEFGHNMGLSHSRGGVMNPSITQGKFDNDEWRGDPSESQLARWFGGEPVDLDNKPDDEPDDPKTPKNPNEYWFSGDFTLMKGEEEVNDYILVPKPKV